MRLPQAALVPVANSRLSDEHFVQEQDHDRRPEASAGPLNTTPRGLAPYYSDNVVWSG